MLQWQRSTPCWVSKMARKRWGALPPHATQVSPVSTFAVDSWLYSELIYQIRSLTLTVPLQERLLGRSTNGSTSNLFQERKNRNLLYKFTSAGGGYYKTVFAKHEFPIISTDFPHTKFLIRKFRYFVLPVFLCLRDENIVLKYFFKL